MSYTVLARRYRSASFDEIIGQEQVARTLIKAIETERIAHAYLFCGARGTGKTSTARILAKCLNCLKHKEPAAKPCNKCDSCLSIAAGQDIDVIEIDAASNTSVENVRDIIANAAFRPARARFKIYIIDEVHMLSKNAFNALLKTLEEPPSHVKFILATTEPEKVLATILSRCQRYDFRTIAPRQITAHLKDICKQEKVSADDEALMLVAKAAAGSMRDALSLLERMLSVGVEKLTVAKVEELMGLPKAQSIYELAEAIGKGDVPALLAKADGLMSAGLSADALLGALVEHLRDLLIVRACGEQTELVDAPAVGMAELSAQAKKFDPVSLTQNVVILEELRRNLRHGQGGRPLLDATLVRLAMADQFAAIGDLLSQGEQPGAVGAEKKKFDDAQPVAAAEAMASRNHLAIDPQPNPPPPRPTSGPEYRERGKESEVPSKQDRRVAASPPPPRSPVAPPREDLTPANRDIAPPRRLTAAITAEIEKDPLVRAVIQELGGRIVKVDESSD